ncbi:hypothetical protein BVX98_00660, partial [bacterium F11]
MNTLTRLITDQDNPEIYIQTIESLKSPIKPLHGIQESDRQTDLITFTGLDPDDTSPVFLVVNAKDYGDYADKGENQYTLTKLSGKYQTTTLERITPSFYNQTSFLLTSLLFFVFIILSIERTLEPIYFIDQLTASPLLSLSFFKESLTSLLSQMGLILGGYWWFLELTRNRLESKEEKQNPLGLAFGIFFVHFLSVIEAAISAYFVTWFPPLIGLILVVLFYGFFHMLNLWIWNNLYEFHSSALYKLSSLPKQLLYHSLWKKEGAPFPEDVKVIVFNWDNTVSLMKKRLTEMVATLITHGVTTGQYNESAYKTAERLMDARSLALPLSARDLQVIKALIPSPHHQQYTLATLEEAIEKQILEDIGSFSIPGVLELIRLLKSPAFDTNYKVVALTTQPLESVKHESKLLGIDGLLDYIEKIDETNMTEDDTLESIRVGFGVHDPHQGIYINNSTKGMESAAKAGLLFFGVATGKPTTKHLKIVGADFVIPNFTDISPVNLARFLSGAFTRNLKERRIATFWVPFKELILLPGIALVFLFLSPGSNIFTLIFLSSLIFTLRHGLKRERVRASPNDPQAELDGKKLESWTRFALRFGVRFGVSYFITYIALLHFDLTSSLPQLAFKPIFKSLFIAYGLHAGWNDVAQEGWQLKVESPQINRKDQRQQIKDVISLIEQHKDNPAKLFQKVLGLLGSPALPLEFDRRLSSSEIPPTLNIDIWAKLLA